MKCTRIIFAALAGYIVSSGYGASANDVPGTVPAYIRNQARQTLMPRGTASGLKVIYRKFGRYRLSVDAAGSNNSYHCSIVP